MTTLTMLAGGQLEALRGGNGWSMRGPRTTSSSIVSMADYKNSLTQSSVATNLVIGGGKNSFAGVTASSFNVAEQLILA